MSKLKEIIDECISQAATDDLSFDWDQLGVDTIAAIKDMLLAMVNDCKESVTPLGTLTKWIEEL